MVEHVYGVGEKTPLQLEDMETTHTDGRQDVKTQKQSMKLDPGTGRNVALCIGHGSYVRLMHTGW